MTASSGGITLHTLADAGVGRVIGDATTIVRGVQHDSRAVGEGDLFVAIPGATHDGATFASDAVERGAAAVATERALELEVPQLVVDDAREALARAASLVYGDPTATVATVGITGTNGKTTTAWLLEEALHVLGERPAMMGTVTFRGPDGARPAPHTTPEADDVARFARDVADAGATHLVMEVSSHGLALKRVEGLRFRVAAFTNLSQDHLDFHGDLDAYGAAKARLFLDLSPATAVINVDDDFGMDLAERVAALQPRVPLLRCSRHRDARAEVRVTRWSLQRDGLHAEIAVPKHSVELTSPLLGTHNLENLLVAFGCLLSLGYDARAAVQALGQAKGAPGRLERVEDPRDVAVLVDYAHTPDALHRALDAVRPVTPGRLFVVFGCGGDRDRGKRPRMGSAAGAGADLCVVTSDNPRTEDPAAIVEAILPGVESAGQQRIDVASLPTAEQGFVAEVDRAKAIRLAIGAARAGDTVLIAGKGHEDYQIVGTEKRHFDDREEARAAIADAVGGGKA